MLVSGFGSGSFIPYKTQKADVVKDKVKQEIIITQEKKQALNPVIPPQNIPAPAAKKNIFQKILDAIF